MQCKCIIDSLAAHVNFLGWLHFGSIHPSNFLHVSLIVAIEWVIEIFLPYHLPEVVRSRCAEFQVDDEKIADSEKKTLHTLLLGPMLKSVEKSSQKCEA